MRDASDLIKSKIGIAPLIKDPVYPDDDWNSDSE